MTSNPTSRGPFVQFRLNEQARVMAAIVSNIRAQTDWGIWSSECKNVLIAALLPVDQNRQEEIKAETLKWHLFRANLPHLDRPKIENEDLAERVRADVPGLVKLGAGRYLYRKLVQEYCSDINLEEAHVPSQFRHF